MEPPVTMSDPKTGKDPGMMYVREAGWRFTTDTCRVTAPSTRTLVSMNDASCVHKGEERRAQSGTATSPNGEGKSLLIRDVYTSTCGELGPGDGSVKPSLPKIELLSGRRIQII